jgi:rhomboid protease GluP
VDQDDLPEELKALPEKRLAKTLIEQAPHPKSAWVALISILFVTLVTQVYWSHIFAIHEKLPVSSSLVFDQLELWRLFTATLIHANIGHLLSNLYMLGIFSYFIYGYYGSSIFPLLSFFFAGAVNLLTIWSYPPEVRLLGASGWVYLLGGFWLTMYIFIQRKYSFGHRLLRATGMALMVFFPTSFEPTTSYRAHFIGFIFGILLAICYFTSHHKTIRSKEVFEII